MWHWFLGSLFVVSTVLACEANGFEDTASAPTDTEISKHIVGKWAFDEVGELGLQIKGTANYNKDGTFAGEATIVTSERLVKIVLSGTWKVADGVIASTVTKSSMPAVIGTGCTYKFQVVAIDERSLKYKNEADKEIVRMRVQR